MTKPTDDELKLIEKMWADGMSGGQIAAALGTGRTSNSIIGIVHRAGFTRPLGQSTNRAADVSLERRLSQVPPSEAAPVEKKSPRPRGFAFGGLPPADKAAGQKPAEPKAAPDGADTKVDIWNLTDYTCRWPLWANTVVVPFDEQFYCGKPANYIGGRKYCAFHAHHG